MSVLDWQLRDVLSELRDQGRLSVLISLLLHANIRMRCWVGTERLINETGWEVGSVVAAKKWLAERGAIALVPYRLRVDEERKLPARQHVIQLTGMIRDKDGELRRYLHMTPEAEEAVKVSLSEISLSKVLVSETKGSSISKGGSKKKIHASAKANAGAVKEKTPAQKLYDAILEVWGYQGGLNGDMAKMLTGQSTKKAFKPYNLPADQPVTAEELLAWAKAWKTAHPKLDMLAERGKVQSAILNWRAAPPVTAGNAAVDQDDYKTVEMTVDRFTPIVPEGDDGRGAN